LIGNGLYLLLHDREKWETLGSHPEKIATAVEEMLRFEPPVQATQRFVKEDLSFHGHEFKKGQTVFVSIAAGNRDPRANERPDEFDLSRKKVNQVSFGYGIHLCIGASLARLETKVTFEKLLAHYPDLALVSEKPQWGNNPFFRGHETLEVHKGIT